MFGIRIALLAVLALLAFSVTAANAAATTSTTTVTFVVQATYETKKIDEDSNPIQLNKVYSFEKNLRSTTSLSNIAIDFQKWSGNQFWCGKSPVENTYNLFGTKVYKDRKSTRAALELAKKIVDDHL